MVQGNTVEDAIGVGADRPVCAIGPVGGALNSGIAADLHATRTSAFIKGLPADRRQIATQHREAALAAQVTCLGPGCCTLASTRTRSSSPRTGWAWPTLGAGFIDPACAALWLIAEGHTLRRRSLERGDMPTFTITHMLGYPSSSPAQFYPGFPWHRFTWFTSVLLLFRTKAT
ncbi:hypothetical protein [Amycolatopsis speibonae]|uniref:Uncharacterized protein n=1 Tax=Amycolatopsis speibonae TaxID=1450224 RepID=A0ABV7PEA7_9PSEU